MKIYVLTKEYNEYDQYGSYFVRAFKEKPTYEQALPFIQEEYHLEEHQRQCYRGLIDHGGGRMGLEHGWFNLEEMEI